jgi:aminoglycoside phosphotransferase (APT) family kinase protein
LIGIKRDNRDFDTLISNIIVRISKIDKTNKLYTAVLKMQKYYKKAPQDRPTYGFLHGDLHKGNILVYESKLIGIVDLGKSIIGDIHKDFSHHMRHYPEYIDIIIESYENETGVKLSKNKIIFYAFLKDMEKLIYHLDKYEMHTKKMVKKVNLYNNLLTN